MIKHLLHDNQFYWGTFGAMLSITGKVIYDNVSTILGLLATIGGLIIVVFSIIEKSKKNKMIDKENRIRDIELEIKQEELRKLRNR